MTLYYTGYNKTDAITSRPFPDKDRAIAYARSCHMNVYRDMGHNGFVMVWEYGKD